MHELSSSREARLAAFFGVPWAEQTGSGASAVRDSAAHGSALDEALARKLAEYQLARPEVPPEDAEGHPRELLWWLLHMARHTLWRLVHRAPALGRAHEARFLELTRARPREVEEHAQLHIDAASALRRAGIVQQALEHAPGPVLLVGDDDAVSVALMLLGVRELHVVDVDERLLSFLSDCAKQLGTSLRVGCVDVFEDPAPLPWRSAYSAVITDPIRSFDPCLAFLRYAGSCLAPKGAGLFWADHEDWNLDLGRVLAELPQLDLTLTQRSELWHAYPLTETWLTDLPGKAQVLGMRTEELATLAGATRGWSHLYQLRRPGSNG
jgi:hypothetical protein